MLRLISLIAFVALVVQVGYQIHKVQRKKESLRQIETSINWLLLAITLVSFGGSFYANNDRIEGWPFGLEKTIIGRKVRVTSVATIDCPHQVTLSGGQARVNFSVPRNTRMKLVLNGTVLAIVHNENSDKPVKLAYLVCQTGRYQVIADRGQHTTTATLTVK
ncbi:hypothetical protein [uncultured Limosilactobacillus sp.]|uniref:hypothetical protein n=1 Tax=uncultured Limosilactobacillus sp. TaxID=2837629 RepID=UPI0025D14C0F|nr:hypothetical protein [uncultured Limosilactobacillus sp.]